MKVASTGLFIYILSVVTVFSQVIRSSTDTKGLLLNNTPTKDTILSSAITELRSKNRAFYPPRMPYDSISRIPNPQVGAVVFDTDAKALRSYNGIKWVLNALPKSGSVISESHPNDTLISEGYQYSGSFSAKKVTTYSSLGVIHHITDLDAPFLSPDGGNLRGEWIQNKLVVINIALAGAVYDPENKSWSTIVSPPSLPQNYYIIFRGVLNDKYAFILDDNGTYKIYTYSMTLRVWNVYSYPNAGNSTITKVRNTIVFWKIGSNLVNVFTGSQLLPITTNSSFPNISAVYSTFAYNDDLVVLWEESGVIKGKKVDVSLESPYINPSSPRYFPPSWMEMSSTNSPSITSNPTINLVNDNLIFWGGNSGGTYINTGSIYNFTTNQWVTINSMGGPDGKSGVYIGEYKGKIVIFGGTNFYGFIDAVGGIYDINTQSWTLFNTNDRPWMGYNPQIFIYKNYLYFKGATTPTGGMFAQYTVSSGRYNLILNQWEGTSNVNVGTVYGINLWTGKYYISWLGNIGGVTGASNLFLRDGFIESDESFGVDKAYHLYSRQ